jgi:D-amino-acid oxidase
MRRASFIAGSSATGLAVLSGVPAAAAQATQQLVPLRVDPGLVIRTTVCLRPFREHGFLLRRDTYGGKPVVHNYGHGGGGVSLSWGVASLAADLADGTNDKTAAVIGAGAVGLATARVLQDRGYRVTIYAAEAPLATTSSRAGAQWSPVTTIRRQNRTAAYDALLTKASERAYRTFQDLVGGDYGVRWIENYSIDDDPSTGFLENQRSYGLGACYPDVRVFGPGEHPFPGKYATRFATMLIDPPTYLAAVFRDALLRGAAFNLRSFDAIEQIAALPEAIVFNCTGLGAKALFGDNDLTPIKGQLTFLLPQPEVDYITLVGNSDLYMFPRADGVALGGTHQTGNWSLDVDADAKARVLRDHARFFDAMRT